VRPLAERLAGYADRLRYEDLDPGTVERIKMHLIDSVGCAIAAFDEEAVRACRKIALSAGGGSATVMGTCRRTTADLAAFANGATIRHYDLNDVYTTRQTACHPSDNISACLAVAEAERASPTDLIVAIALAYEINCRLIDAFDLSARGWDDATIFSLPAAALAAGKLMRLPPDRLEHAISLAINDHIPMGQTRAGRLSDWKGLADAEAARHGVFAALLARAGISGPAPVFEGRKGFFQLVSGAVEVDVDAFGGRCAPFRIHQCGLKAYPVVVFAQTAVEAAIAVGQEVGNLDLVAALEIATTQRGYESAGRDPEKWAPENRETADHSLPYVAARAMLDGGIDNASYQPDKLADPRVRALMSKATVIVDPSFSPPPGGATPTRLVATLSDGRRVARQIDGMRGFAGQPMTPADVDSKFRSNVGRRWPEQRTDEVLDALWGLDRAGDLGSVLGRLEIPSGAG
jgi:2-methylcitrate dehydratase